MSREIRTTCVLRANLSQRAERFAEARTRTVICERFGLDEGGKNDSEVQNGVVGANVVFISNYKEKQERGKEPACVCVSRDSCPRRRGQPVHLCSDCVKLSMQARCSEEL
ncbi:uncharacterized [Tachysurus ichikawai]